MPPSSLLTAPCTPHSELEQRCSNHQPANTTQPAWSHCTALPFPLAPGPELDRYRRAVVDSFVEDNGAARFCPSTPWCGHAVLVSGEVQLGSV